MTATEHILQDILPFISPSSWIPFILDTLHLATRTVPTRLSAMPIGINFFANDYERWRYAIEEDMDTQGT